MQPVTKQLLGGLSTIGVPVRSMQKICPQGANGTTLQLRAKTAELYLQADSLSESVGCLGFSAVSYQVIVP